MFLVQPEIMIQESELGFSLRLAQSFVLFGELGVASRAATADLRELSGLASAMTKAWAVYVPVYNAPVGVNSYLQAGSR
jgi:hypothetical protein